MTDKEIFEKFMGWMGMHALDSHDTEEGTAIIYNDTGECSERFSKRGYDEFYAGAIFDESGAIVRAYLDSHVAYVSSNCKAISKLLGYDDGTYC